jgi:hypothetical protein
MTFFFVEIADLNDSKSSTTSRGYKNENKKRKNVEGEVVLRKRRFSSNYNENDNKTEDKKSFKDENLNNSLKRIRKHVSVSSLTDLFRSKVENNSTNIRPTNLKLGVSTMALSNSNSCKKPLSTSNQNLAQNFNVNAMFGQNSTFCHICEDKVYLMERLNIMGLFMHPFCFRCDYCSRALQHNATYSYLKDPITNKCK